MTSAKVRAGLLVSLVAVSLASGATPPIVFTQIPIGSPAEKASPRSGGMLGADYGEGAHIVLLRPGQPPRMLTQGFTSAADPDVSFDGKRILFAGRKLSGDRWTIYEMNADGTGLREVFGGPDDLRQPIYLPPIYTLTTDPYKGTDPWEQIAYVRVSSTETNENGDAPRSNIAAFRVGEPDGKLTRLGHPLAFNLSNEMDPAVLPDGRILFASLQRSTLDRGVKGRISLLGMNPDGTDPSLIAADEGRRIKRMPCVTTDRLVVFVEGDSAGWDGAGSLGGVSLRRTLHSYRRITTENAGIFHSPSALPGGGVLVAMRPAAGGGTYGIVRLDPISGTYEKVFDDPRYHDIQAKAVAPRARPDSRSTPIKDSETEGKLYGLNVYMNDLPPDSLPIGSIKRLRVIEGLPNHTGDNVSARGPAPLARRRLLGEAPVLDDGSFHIQIPANLPVQLQILDSDGMALRSSGWIWVRNKGQQGCVGCHENPELTPQNRFAAALEAPGIKLNLPPDKRRSVDFKHDVMPIVEARCVSCHGGGDKVPLDAGRAYATLLAGVVAREEGPAAGSYVDPGRSRTSPLIWHLLGRNTARPWDGAASASAFKPMPPGSGLTDDERRLFVEWIDLGALLDETEGR